MSDKETPGEQFLSILIWIAIIFIVIAVFAMLMDSIFGGSRELECKKDAEAAREEQELWVCTNAWPR